jgi:hypothetical protein
MEVASFAEIAEEFHARIARIAWATVATVGPTARLAPGSCICSGPQHPPSRNDPSPRPSTKGINTSPSWRRTLP